MQKTKEQLPRSENNDCSEESRKQYKQNVIDLLPSCHTYMFVGDSPKTFGISAIGSTEGQVEMLVTAFEKQPQLFEVLQLAVSIYETLSEPGDE